MFKSLLQILGYGYRWLKPHLRWLVPLVTLGFLAWALRQHWQQVWALQIRGLGWLWLGLGLLSTLAAFLWSGWLWGSLFGLLGYPIDRGWAARLYLTTNIAKYLPSNVLHFYTRITQTHAAGVPLGLATLVVGLEPFLMVAAGLLLILINLPGVSLPLQGLALVLVLLGLHPRLLNLLLARSLRKQSSGSPPLQLKAYPFLPLLGEVVFVGLRAAGFILTLLALGSVPSQAVFPLVGAYSLGWLLGMVTPGAPGGVGVVELTVIQVLKQPQYAHHLGTLPPAQIIAGVALYRLISTGAEALSAGVGWWRPRPHPNPPLASSERPRQDR
jgi:glycosyltransferase 2 family protein